MTPIKTAGAWNEQSSDSPWWAEFDIRHGEESVLVWAQGFVSGVGACLAGENVPPYCEVGEMHDRLWVLVHSGETRDGKACRYLPKDALDGFTPTDVG